LYADPVAKIFNMVVEIPRWTNAKMEVSLKYFLLFLIYQKKDGNKRANVTNSSR